MNKIVIVGSTIQAREGKFTYSKTRTIFDANERFRQTIATVNSLTNALPDAKIYVVDSSDQFEPYVFPFSMIGPSVTFVPVKELDSDACEIINSHTNKSYCESLILNTFYNKFRAELENADYVIKATGRYMYFDLNDKIFNESNTDKIFFKPPLKFNWSDNWDYHLIDRRKQQNDNKIYQYCTVLYGFGAQHLQKMIDINDAAMHCISQKWNFDIETLSYYFTRFWEANIIETNWKVCGWDGTSGRLMFY